jgi:hypothetical protein
MARLSLVLLFFALAGCARSPAPVAQPAPPSPLAITLREPRIEACLGMRPFLISLVSWEETGIPAPEGPPVLTYRSLQPAVAVVAQSGEVTTLAAGRAVIEVVAELAGRRASTHGEVIVHEGGLDAQASQQSGRITCKP